MGGFSSPPHTSRGVSRPHTICTRSEDRPAPNQPHGAPKQSTVRQFHHLSVYIDLFCPLPSRPEYAQGLAKEVPHTSAIYAL